MICVVTPFLFAIALGIYVLVQRLSRKSADEVVEAIMAFKEESQDSLAA